MPFLDIETKEDSAQKVEQLAGVDSKLYIKAEEFNATVNAVNDLDARLSATNDKLVVNAGFEINGLAFKLNIGNVWELSGIPKESLTDIVKPIALSNSGMKRQVIALLADNDFYLKYGDEHAQFPPKPIKDAGTVELTDFTVTDSEVGNTTPPIIGDSSVSKQQFNEIGDIGGRFYIFKQSNFIISNPDITEVKGLCNVNEMEEGLYPGKLHYWTNMRNVSVWFRHLDGSDPAVRYPFYFGNGADFELKPGASILFIHSTPNLPIAFEYGYLRFLASSFQQTESKKQITVTGNITATNDWNGTIVKVKASAVITIPSGLVKGFEFDCATFTGATATLAQGAGVTLNSPSGLILQQKKMLTLFNDTLNTYEVRGEQTTS